MSKYINETLKNYPALEKCRGDIEKALAAIIACYEGGGKILCCGNGGSSADCDHFVAELMKGFLKKRPLGESEKARFESAFAADGLQKGLPALSLTSQSSVITAFANDCEPALIFAQQVYALAAKGDLLLAFSTSGNSENIVYALEAAAAKGTTSIAITGESGGKASEKAAVTIKIPETETYRVQELTLPVYHALAAETEEYFFKEA